MQASLRIGIRWDTADGTDVSKSEVVIAEFLSKNNIKHLQEYSFDDLRNKSGNLLRFDFAILDKSNDVRALIEYQGAQHYMENISFGLYQRKS